MSSSVRANELLANRYLLKQAIGRGGFSIVWLAADTHQNNSQVAIKIFAPDKGLDLADIHQFEQEKAKADRLHHPRLLRVLDYFIHDESPCLVLVYMPNGSLFKKIKAQPTGQSEEAVAQVLYQVSDGLEYLHREGIVHLDIKPDNILFDSFHDCVLSDFGISSDMRTTLLHASQVKGQTMAYLSPERVLGTKHLTENVDIFALGVTLYEMCTGIVPDGHIIGQNVAVGLRKPDLPTPNYTNRLQQLIHACWNLHPADRPSASQLKEYAQHYLDRKFWPEIREYRAPSIPNPAPDPVAYYQQPPASPTQNEPAYAGQQMGSGRETEARQGQPASPYTSQGTSRYPGAKPPQPVEREKKKRALLLWGAIVAGALLLLWGGYSWFQGSQRKEFVQQSREALANHRLMAADMYYQKALAISSANTDVQALGQAISDSAEVGYRAAMLSAEGHLKAGAYDAAREDIGRAKAQTKYMTFDSTDLALQRIQYYAKRDSGNALYNKKKDLKALDYYYAARDGGVQDQEMLNRIAELEEKRDAAKYAQFNKDLVAACRKGNYAAAQAALDAGAKPNATGGTTGAALLHAVRSGNLDLVKLLVSKGADANIRSGYLSDNRRATYGSPAVVAAGFNQLSILKYLIENCGVSINSQEYNRNTRRADGWTPLGAAACNGYLSVVRYAHDMGGSVNVRQSGGITPLMEAAEYGHYDIVQYLLSNGASTGATDNNGYNVCAYAAVSTGSTSVRNLLVSRNICVQPRSRQSTDDGNEIKKLKRN